MARQLQNLALPARAVASGAAAATRGARTDGHTAPPGARGAPSTARHASGMALAFGDDVPDETDPDDVACSTRVGACGFASVTSVGDDLAVAVGDDLAVGVGDDVAVARGDDLAVAVGDELAVAVGDELAVAVGDDLAVALGDLALDEHLPDVAPPRRLGLARLPGLPAPQGGRAGSQRPRTAGSRAGRSSVTTPRRPALPSPPPAGTEGELLAERDLKELEREFPDGLTSVQVVDFFTRRSIRFSEATFRKYVQQGLLPRSRRVGRKGKHQGSLGLYPAATVRRINVIKQLQAQNYTIEQIQQQFLRFRDELELVERGLRGLFGGFAEELARPHFDPGTRKQLKKELADAQLAAEELLKQLASIERRVVPPTERPPGGGAPGGAEDLL